MATLHQDKAGSVHLLPRQNEPVEAWQLDGWKSETEITVAASVPREETIRISTLNNSAAACKVS